MYYLIEQKIDTNDADYIYGFAIFDSTRYLLFFNDARKIFEKLNGESYTSYFSDSPFYINDYKEFHACNTVKEITDEEAETIKKLFNMCYGTWGRFEEMEYWEE